MKQNYTAKKILSSKLAIFCLLIIFILLASVIVKNLNQQKNNTEKAFELENEIFVLEKQNQELSQLIDFFSETEFVEKQAREKLGLAKPGEKLVIIPEQKQENTKTQKNKSMPELWFEYFFQ